METATNRRAAPYRIALALLVAGGIGATPASAAIPDGERAALIAFYEATNGDAWTDNAGWCAGACPASGTPAFAAPGSECGWYGVGCDVASQHVVSIELPENDLTGTLPSLGAFTALEVFDIHLNQVGGSIQSDLAALSSLRTFDVHYNALTGTLPSLAGMTALTYFDVFANQLTGELPSFNGLGALEVFNADNNFLEGSIPPLSDLTALVHFDVDTNFLTGSIPSLAGLTSLSYFGVYNNQLSGALPSLAGLAALQTFDASANGLTGGIPSLAGLSALEYFSVRVNRLVGAVPSLADLTSLQVFLVDRNELGGTLPTAPASLLPGQSLLCPNLFDLVPDAGWDAAVGESPWWGNPPMCGDRIFSNGFDGG